MSASFVRAEHSFEFCWSNIGMESGGQIQNPQNKYLNGVLYQCEFCQKLIGPFLGAYILSELSWFPFLPIRLKFHHFYLRFQRICHRWTVRANFSIGLWFTNVFFHVLPHILLNYLRRKNAIEFAVDLVFTVMSDNFMSDIKKKKSCVSFWSV